MDKIKIPTGETLLTDRLPNGLFTFVYPKPGFQKKYAVLSTHYGSLDSKFNVPGEGIVEVPEGIAHFLEHKLFEEEEGNSFDRFGEWGASVNAFTSYVQTSYLFSTVEYFQDALAQLVKFVMHPYLTDENVEKEKGIIEQELLMYEDHPDRRLHTNLLNALYHENPVRIDIGGTPQSVREITVEWLLKCYNTFYQAPNMALFVVGDVDPEQTIQTVRDNFPNWDQPQDLQIERIYPDEPLEVAEPWVEDRLSISRPRYALGFKNEPHWRGEDLLKQQIVMGLVWRLIAARSSQIYEDLYNAELIDDSFGASFNAAPQYTYSVLATQTDDPRRLDEELRSIINKLKTSPISESDVERLKRQVYGGHIANYDSLEYVANTYIAHYFNDTPYHKFLNILQDVTVDDVARAINESLDLDKSAVSILWPSDHKKQ